MPEQTVFLNGEYLPLSEAKISVLDRGFIFGDGVYEVIPAYGGQLFRFNEHMARLQDNLDAIRLNNPYDHSDWQEILTTLLKAEGREDQSVYLQLTRGVAPRQHAFPKTAKPTVFAMSNPLPKANTDLLKKGIEAISLHDSRWQHCHIKSIALQANILLHQQAMDEQVTEAILIRDGLVTEGTASNIFIVHQGVIKTPQKDHHLLPGITRDLVVELAHNNNLDCEETTITENELQQADEIWLTSSSKEILPVTRLNHQAVGDARPGPLWQKMYTLFQAYKTKLRNPV